jgi:disease resistance protein RPM1
LPPNASTKLKYARYLIVIDDLWHESAWKHIKCALIENNLGSKIITTTRIMGVAEICCSSDLVDGSIYELRPLSLADSESLFYHKVCRQGVLPSELKDMVQKILRKCEGLPLFIVTVANLFAHKWAEVDDRLYSLCNYIETGLEDSNDMKDMQGILSLSYFDLPSQLKTCLLYLSIFPEDHIIERDDLIHRWIAEGFIHAKHGVSQHEQGESYFKQLINRSLIQPVHVGTHDRSQDCRVHDMVLEFITSLAMEENFVTIVSSMKPTSFSGTVRRLSVQGNIEKQAIHHATKDLSHVRSLTVFCEATDLNLPISSFQLLHVLELKNCNNCSIKGIGSLTLLKYLRLSSTDFLELPAETGNLQFLQTLDVKQAVVKELPSTLVKLGQLGCLYVNTQTKLPDGIGNIKSLEELSEIDISKYPNLLSELGNLSQLRVLKMSLRTWDENYEKPLLECIYNLKKLQNLSIFTSCVSLDFMSAANFSPSRLLRRFMVCVPGHRENIFEQCAEINPFSTLPRWINSTLLKLSDLSIMVSKLSQQDLEILRDLPTLYSLDLHVGKVTTQKLVVTSNTMPAFKCLAKFKFTSRAMVLVFKRGAMQKLQALSLSFHLKETKSVLSSFNHGFENLTSLKVVDIAINCQFAFLWEVKAAEAAIKSAINLNPNHPTLDITRHFEREMLWHQNQDIAALETMKEDELVVWPCSLWLHSISLSSSPNSSLSFIYAGWDG